MPFPFLQVIGEAYQWHLILKILTKFMRDAVIKFSVPSVCSRKLNGILPIRHCTMLIAGSSRVLCAVHLK